MYCEGTRPVIGGCTIPLLCTLVACPNTVQAPNTPSQHPAPSSGVPTSPCIYGIISILCFSVFLFYKITRFLYSKFRCGFRASSTPEVTLPPVVQRGPPLFPTFSDIDNLIIYRLYCTVPLCVFCV